MLNEKRRQSCCRVQWLSFETDQIQQSHRQWVVPPAPCDTTDRHIHTPPTQVWVSVCSRTSAVLACEKRIVCLRSEMLAVLCACFRTRAKRRKKEEKERKRERERDQSVCRKEELEYILKARIYTKKWRKFQYVTAVNRLSDESIQNTSATSIHALGTWLIQKYLHKYIRCLGPLAGGFHSLELTATLQPREHCSRVLIFHRVCVICEFRLKT